jgi:hypothetical protein
MMNQWVRLWGDMPDDAKWLVVRHRASQSVTGVTVGHVISVFVKMMTNADYQGNLVNWDDEDVAVRLEYETKQVLAIREAMQGKVLDGNHLKGWEKRQPKREDSSAVRMRASRAKRDAARRDVTQCDAPEEKRLDKKQILKNTHCPKNSDDVFFDKFWEGYGHKLQRKRAETAFKGALGKVSFETIMAAVEAYHRGRPAWQKIALAGAWLEGERWTDQPEAPPNGHAETPAKKAVPPPRLPGQDRLQTSSGLWVDGKFYPIEVPNGPR